MDPKKLPFNTLIVGPMNSGKSNFVVDRVYDAFRGKFDYIMLICLTFENIKTYHRIGKNDPRMFDNMQAAQGGNVVEAREMSFEGTNTLIILNDCAASKDVKWRTGELVNLDI